MSEQLKMFVFIIAFMFTCGMSFFAGYISGRNKSKH